MYVIRDSFGAYLASYKDGVRWTGSVKYAKGFLYKKEALRFIAKHELGHLNLDIVRTGSRFVHTGDRIAFFDTYGQMVAFARLYIGGQMLVTPHWRKATVFTDAKFIMDKYKEELDKLCMEVARRNWTKEVTYGLY